MIKIAHRGNFWGRNEKLENSPDYIEEAIRQGYHVEIDVRRVGYKWLLGHDTPDYEVRTSFLQNNRLWVHAKDFETLFALKQYPDIHCFWHDKDDFTFTSMGIKWARAGVYTADGVIVMPEHSEEISAILRNAKVEQRPFGVCSDHFGLFGF